jgi:predicted esterase
MPPEDLDYAAHRNYLKDKNLYLIYGTSDPFLTPDRFSLLQEIEDKNGVDFEAQTFDGGHEIPSEVLRQLMLSLR